MGRKYVLNLVYVIMCPFKGFIMPFIYNEVWGINIQRVVFGVGKPNESELNI